MNDFCTNAENGWPRVFTILAVVAACVGWVYSKGAFASFFFAALCSVQLICFTLLLCNLVFVLFFCVAAVDVDIVDGTDEGRSKKAGLRRSSSVHTPTKATHKV